MPVIRPSNTIAKPLATRRFLEMDNTNLTAFPLLQRLKISRSSPITRQWKY